jgi:formylglycine-generating enzyme required for sulfatase activity
MAIEFRANLESKLNDRFKYNLLPLALIILSLTWLSSAESSEHFSPGDSFSDCNDCPEMVVIPAGSFEMGDTTGKRSGRERPVHKVTFKQQFAIGKYEITFADWDSCVANGGCKHSANDKNYGRGQRPVGDVGWNDAVEYVSWLSKKTGHHYRLPSEAEWEYVRRADSTKNFPWGNKLGKGNAVCYTCGIGGVSAAISATVGSYAANQFGVYDMVGLVSEWVEDCGNNNYENAPTDGSAWLTGDCSRRVERGGSWYDDENYLGPTYRYSKNVDARQEDRGFRVARSFP